MGLFNPIKKLKKAAGIAKKLDPLGSKIAAAGSPAIKKLMADDKNKRLYQNSGQVRESITRREPGADEVER